MNKIDKIIIFLYSIIGLMNLILYAGSLYTDGVSVKNVLSSHLVVSILCASCAIMQFRIAQLEAEKLADN